MKKIFFYVETKENLNWKNVSNIKEINNLGYDVNFCDSLLHWVPEEKRYEIARSFASARIVAARSPIINPFPYEIEYEMGRFFGNKSVGVLYDAVILRNIYFKILSLWMKKNPLDHVHIVVTDDLIATIDYDGYYHGRIALFSFPTIISVSGIRYVPARSKQYYWAWMVKMALGETFSPNLEFPEERLPDIFRGYMIQSIFFYFTGNPFCEDKNCRLFNAHWLRDMIQSQIISGKLCEKHRRMLMDL
ncbi:MAG: hypothetical protein N2513_07840 [Deltaproteobacteria bacterium]|nr:hypothetical protein [Deltaproteobacteria bacterium]